MPFFKNSLVLISTSKIRYRSPVSLTLSLALLGPQCSSLANSCGLCAQLQYEKTQGWLWIKLSNWFTHVHAAKLLSVFVCVCVSCHSVNINHNSLCCQSRGLRLRLNISGNIRGGQTHQTSGSISIPSAFHSHSISSKTNEEISHWAWADTVHRQNRRS